MVWPCSCPASCIGAYTFGLGFAVRLGGGVASVPGSPGEFMWARYAGTYFWVDPKEELVAVRRRARSAPLSQAAGLRCNRRLIAIHQRAVLPRIRRNAQALRRVVAR